MTYEINLNYSTCQGYLVQSLRNHSTKRGQEVIISENRHAGSLCVSGCVSLLLLWGKNPHFKLILAECFFFNSNVYFTAF